MALNREVVLQGVREIVSEQLNVALDKVTEESQFVEDFGADSLDSVELLMEFEDEFDIDIPDDPDGQGITSVKLAVDYIVAHKSGEQGQVEDGSTGKPGLRGVPGL